jgi:hypothetical protein
MGVEAVTLNFPSTKSVPSAAPPKKVPAVVLG